MTRSTNSWCSKFRLLRLCRFVPFYYVKWCCCFECSLCVALECFIGFLPCSYVTRTFTCTTSLRQAVYARSWCLQFLLVKDNRIIVTRSALRDMLPWWSSGARNLQLYKTVLRRNVHRSRMLWAFVPDREKRQTHHEYSRKQFVKTLCEFPCRQRHGLEFACQRTCICVLDKRRICNWRELPACKLTVALV